MDLVRTVCQMAGGMGEALSTQPGLQQAATREEEMENEVYGMLANICNGIGQVGDALSILNEEPTQQSRWQQPQLNYQQPETSQNQVIPGIVEAARAINGVANFYKAAKETGTQLQPLPHEIESFWQGSAALSVQIAKHTANVLEEKLKPKPELKKRKPFEERVLEFYENKIPFEDGEKIDDFLSDSFGDHGILTKDTEIIQWLFPNPKSGKKKEFRHLARAIKSDEVLRERVKRAFRLILHLYGMRFNDQNEFRLKNADPQCLEHFISHEESPKYVSRILYALNELGHEDLSASWLIFLRELIFDMGLLPDEFKTSFNDYWT